MPYPLYVLKSSRMQLGYVVDVADTVGVVGTVDVLDMADLVDVAERWI